MIHPSQCIIWGVTNLMSVCSVTGVIDLDHLVKIAACFFFFFLIEVYLHTVDLSTVQFSRFDTHWEGMSFNFTSFISICALSSSPNPAPRDLGLQTVGLNSINWIMMKDLFSVASLTCGWSLTVPELIIASWCASLCFPHRPVNKTRE